MWGAAFLSCVLRLRNLRSQQVNQVIGGVGVGPQGWAGHVAGGVSPALVPVVGSVSADGSGQGLAENDGALGPFGGHHVAGRLAHHSHHVQRAVDLRERTNLRVTMGIEIYAW